MNNINSQNTGHLSEYRRRQQEKWAQQERQKEEQLKHQKEQEEREERERLEKLREDEEFAKRLEEEMLREEHEIQAQAEALARKIQQEEDEELARSLQQESEEESSPYNLSQSPQRSTPAAATASRPIYEEVPDDDSTEVLPDPYVDRLIDDDETMTSSTGLGMHSRELFQQQPMIPNINNSFGIGSASNHHSSFQRGGAVSRSVSRRIRNGMVEETITETMPGTDQVRTTTRTYPAQQHQQQPSQGRINSNNGMMATDSFFANFNENSMFGMNSMLDRMRRQMNSFSFQ